MIKKGVITMKKLLSVVLIVALSCIALFPAYAADDNLIATDEFLVQFTLYAALLNTGHALSTENADEITHFSDMVLFKTIFNKCEILSLILTPDGKEVTSIKCTWSTLTPGASAYSEDFIYLLMEVLCACGMDTDSIADLLVDLGMNNAFDVGDSGEATNDGIKVSYEVTSTFGVSFKIEKA